MLEMQHTPERASAQEKLGPTRTAHRCGDGPAGVPQDVSPKQYGPGGWPGPYLFLPLHRRDTAGGPLKPSVGWSGTNSTARPKQGSNYSQTAPLKPTQLEWATGLLRSG